MLVIQVQGQTTVKAKLGDGIKIMAGDSSFSMKLGLRFQTLFNAEAPSDDPQNIRSNMMIRRSRIKADGFIFSERFKYKFELGLSNRDIGPATPETNNAPMMVFDAVLKYKVFEGMEVWFGQTKLPGNRERVVSSQNLQLVDRSLLNSYFNIDRDLGFQFRFEQSLGKMVFRELAAVSQGEGRNVTTRSQGFDYTGRLEFLPMGEFTDDGDYVGAAISREESPKLSLAVTYDFNDEAQRTGGQLGDWLVNNRDMQTLFADMMFKYGGFSMMGEYAMRDIEETMFSSGETSLQRMGQAFNLQAGYVFKNGIEPAIRYTAVDFADAMGNADETQYTVGLSKYFSGHELKVQTDLSYLDIAGTPTDELMYRFQVEVAF